MKIILVRHGQTKENLHKILQGGRIEGTLSQKGIEDTKKLANWILKNNFKIDVVFCSDLYRTRQTLEILQTSINCSDVYYTSKLREQDFGDWTGKGYDEVDFTSPPDNQELLENVQKRVINFLQAQFITYKNRTILIITHHGVIGTLICKIRNLSAKEAFLVEQDNTALNIIEMKDEENFEIKTLNSVAHLN